MKKTIALIFSLALLTFCKPERKHLGSIERIDPALDSIITTTDSPEIIAEGYEWSEGPVWVESQNMLLYSDVPKNTVYKWTESRGAEVYLTPSGYTGSSSRGGETGSNGLTLNGKGQLVLCQHGDRRVAIMDAPLDKPAPVFVTIADNYQGKKFDSPNDVAIRSNGDVFFTDPPYGLENYVSDSTKEAPYQGVYKVSADGKVTLLVDSLTRPNGIALMPDEKTLIVANSDPNKAILYAFDLTENDSLVNARVFYDTTPVSKEKKEKGLPDGLRIDRKGNVFATGPGGVWIFNKEGKLLGKIKIPEATANCALAEDDTMIYFTSDMYVLRLKMR